MVRQASLPPDGVRNDHGEPSILGMDWVCPLSRLSTHAQFIRTVDWANTLIGPPSGWPQQLHETIDFVLVDPNPACVMWQDGLTMIYNEPFVQFAGEKHPSLMGRSPRTEYAEVWAMFEDIIQRGKMTGKATRHSNVQLFLHRHGFLEECFVTYTFTPILSASKQVIAFYHTAVETTSQVIAERRNKTLLALGDSIMTSRSLQEYWDNILKTLEANTHDISYALAYAFEVDSGPESTVPSSADTNSSQMRVPRSCTLAGATGKAIGKVPLSFQVRDDQDDMFVEIVKQTIRSGELRLVNPGDLGAPQWLFDPDKETNNGAGYTSVLIVPVRPTNRIDATGKNTIGFLILGLNPKRPFDKDCEQFAQILSRQLAASSASILLLEQEVRRQQQLTQQLTIQSREAQELEKKFSRFAEISNIGMWICSPKGELLYANRAWYEQADAEYNQPNFTVETWMPLVKPESLAVFLEEWRRLMVDRVSINFECQFKATWRSKDPTSGEILEGGRWFLITAFPEFTDDGELKSAWGCNIDISYQKWAQGLKDQRLNDVLEAKRQSENFIDMTSHEMRNPLSAILQCADGIKSTLEELSASGTAAHDLILDHESAESISDSAATIMTCAQHQKRIVDDILTLSKLDASLLVVTPDKVDPISTVQHAIQLHSQEFRNAKVQSSFRVADSYHELDIDKVYLDPSRLLQVLINLITNAVKFTQFQEERKVTLHLAASTQSPGEGDADSDYFAPRVTRPAPTLDSEWGAGEELYLRFSVEDTGCGLNKEEMHKLFNRFTQASPKTHVTYGGSGLGLFICKELTELQGGRIGVSSSPGKGSNFRFYIKARRAPPDETEADRNAAKLQRLQRNAEESDSAASQAVKDLKDPEYIDPINREHSEVQNPVVGSATDPNTLHLLVVEDNILNQRVMAQQLRKAGCVVHVADHGADALLFLKRTTFARDCGPNAIPLSLVLMDLEMPIMDGLTCVAKIREWQRSGELTRPVPVIAVTANARLEQVQKAKDHGMDSVVTKPFRIKELIPECYNLIAKAST